MRNFFTFLLYIGVMTINTASKAQEDVRENDQSKKANFLSQQELEKIKKNAQPPKNLEVAELDQEHDIIYFRENDKAVKNIRPSQSPKVK